MNILVIQYTYLNYHFCPHRITIFGIRGTFTGWVDNVMDYFVWHNYLSWTTNGIGQQFNITDGSIAVFKTDIPGISPNPNANGSDLSYYWNRSKQIASSFSGIRFLANLSIDSDRATVNAHFYVYYVWWSQARNNWIYWLHNSTLRSDNRFISTTNIAAAPSVSGDNGWQTVNIDSTVPIIGRMWYDSSRVKWYVDLNHVSETPSSLTLDSNEAVPTAIALSVRSSSTLRHPWVTLNSMTVAYVR